eukprot:TRINITY_DN12982_c0_g1_i1.p1 TRINITY_DN12982_c0_g1~~TRINITY_DN12982_c0_g1_i1.p1  ORF type:complete len:226 (-),score=12.37 TRINITY_DN12982_c0_g1_i1:404-1081(-)
MRSSMESCEAGLRLALLILLGLVAQAHCSFPSKIDEVSGSWSGLCVQRIGVSNLSGNNICLGSTQTISYPYRLSIFSNGTIIWSSGGSISNVSVSATEYAYIPTTDDYDGVSRIKPKSGTPGLWESDIGGQQQPECWVYAIENGALIEYDEYSLNAESSNRPCPSSSAANNRAIVCDTQNNYYSYVCTLQKVSTRPPAHAAVERYSASVALTLASCAAVILLQLL